MTILKKKIDVSNDLSDFDDKIFSLQLKVVAYLSKYKSENFDLFFHALN